MTLTSSEDKTEAAEEKAISYCIQKYYEIFKSCDGLDAISSLVDSVAEDHSYQYPISILLSFLPAFSALLSEVKEEDFKVKFLNRLTEGLEKRFAQCRKEDFEEINQMGQESAFKILEDLLGKGNDHIGMVKKQVESFTYVLYLQCEDVGSKVKGLNLMKEKTKLSTISILSIE